MEEIIKEVVTTTGSKISFRKIHIVGTGASVYAIVSYWYNLKEADVSLYDRETDAIEMFDFLTNK